MILSRLTPSGAVLIAANIFPIVGVILWGWSTFEIVFLYWMENVMIGVINVLKMLISTNEANRPDLPPATIEQMQRPGGGFIVIFLIKVLLIPFFILHFGGFCLGHGLAVFAIFHEEGIGISQLFSSEHFLYGIYILAASHVLSFLFNHIGKGEYRKKSLRQIMAAPYARIVVLHIAIMAGAFLTLLFRSSIGVLIALIILKTGIDLHFHTAEHEMLSNVRERKRSNQKLLSAVARRAKAEETAN